ncbi:hypothetical protein F0562_019198 [Nyssa sinensis]|uniref:LIM zinc-binding domain-containing protein n=1 Tax=Nyssa sinensis TaxID=561372 RepID=A0A5J4ZDK5_9ASTE|nr:hypothetical protein F0562_019198 [Nyssa sinensis]
MIITPNWVKQVVSTLLDHSPFPDSDAIGKRHQRVNEHVKVEIYEVQVEKPQRENSLTRAPSKLSSLFSGTQDKCSACTKTVYPLEKVTMEGEPYHKSCFKCAHGGCPLTHSSYAALDGILYCKHHFAQLFMEKGNYSHVLKAATHRKSGVQLVEPESAEEEPKAEAEADQTQGQS